MFTNEQKEFIKKHNLKNLTNSIPEEESLFATLWGARTVNSAMEMEKIAYEFNSRQIIGQKQFIEKQKLNKERLAKIPESMLLKMEYENQKFIDEYGCSMY